jgi:tetratricopeptide (TPR) repeat protein
MDYEKCRAEMAGISKVPKMEAGAAYFLGRVARVEENFDEALADLNRAIKLYPAFGEAHTELARVYLARGELAAARAAVDRAVALDSDNYQANQVLLTVLERTHDSGAEQQAARMDTLDAERSRRRELLLRTIEVKPY